MNEFELIDRYFKRRQSRADVLVGIGDDAALVKPDPGAPVISALATLSLAPGESAGDGAAFARALARSALNRLAAQGAAPAWVTLGLTVPLADSEWLTAFSATLCSAIEPHGAVLVGGDTTRGPTTATLVVHGIAPSPPRSVSPPRPQDPVYVTGELGRAAAQADERGIAAPRPPRVSEGQAAWPYAAAAGDLRDSLAATLLRIIGPFGLGAEIDSARLPVDPAGEEYFRRPGGARLLIDASADAELCFVIGAAEEAAFNEVMASFDARCTRIGRVVNDAGVHLR